MKKLCSFATLTTCLLIANYAEIISANNAEKIAPENSIIWGPGLRPEEIVMKVRYIFLQLQDGGGKNLTTSPGQGIVLQQIKGKTVKGDLCPIRTQIIDCMDGSFIIRYRIFKTCFNLKLSVKVQNTEVIKVQTEFKGPVYEEECNCPETSIIKFLENNECDEKNSQLFENLKQFPSVNFDEIRDDIVKRYDRPQSVSLCHYVVKSNKIYRNCYGQHVGFKMFMDSVLKALTRRVLLPDIEFFMNLGDWPLVKKKEKIFPIFSWCGSKDTADIILPTYDITESSLEAMDRVTMDMLSVQGSTELSWDEKVAKAFWRGRDSRRERLDLIDIARENPDFINASITNFFFFRDEMDKYGPGQKPISMFNFFEYKYQISIDGTVAAYRLPYLLAGGSVVFKQESNYFEYFYDKLTPGEQFLPVKANLSDLVEKIQWARENDKEARTISKNSRQFVRDNLMPKDIICYHMALFTEWNKRLKNEIKVLPNMEEVPQNSHSCDCSTKESFHKTEL